MKHLLWILPLTFLLFGCKASFPLAVAQDETATARPKPTPVASPPRQEAAGGTLDKILTIKDVVALTNMIAVQVLQIKCMVDGNLSKECYEHALKCAKALPELDADKVVECGEAGRTEAGI